MLFQSVVFLITLAATLAFLPSPKTSVNKQSILSMASSFYDLVEKDSKGNDISFDQFKGKVVYGVNVASKCGYTASGYALLSKLAALKEQGIEVAIL